MFKTIVLACLSVTLSGCQYLFGPYPVLSSMTVGISPTVLAQCGSVNWTEPRFKNIDAIQNPPTYTFTFNDSVSSDHKLQNDELIYTGRSELGQESRDYQINMRRVGNYSFNSALRGGYTFNRPTLTCEKSGFSVSTELELGQVESARTMLDVSSDGHLTAVWVKISLKN